VLTRKKAARVLVVDDHIEMAKTVAEGLSDLGYEATPVDSGEKAAQHLAEEGFDALVTDLRMTGVDGLGLLALSRRLDPARPVIVMTAYGAIDTAVESMRQGAYHYLTKPFKLEELVIVLERALDFVRVGQEAAALKKAMAERFSFGNILGNSSGMRSVFDLIERIKDANVPVLITGETGTGKGLVARTLHAAGSRSEHPFVSVNCASLPESLLESELFGHARGAFTGAVAPHAGLFAEADSGTLLLDEVGEMTPALQAKLLHVLETHTVRPVGASKERVVDVRILAATHRDLRQLVQTGQFREDLFYRLDVVSIELPALRHRREDIPALVEHFLAEAKRKHPESRVERFSSEALSALMDHAWPGNVRELAHVVERLVLLGPSTEIAGADLPGSVRPSQAANLPPIFDGSVIPAREVQRRYAAWALEQLGGHRARTAERLGIDAKTLAKWLTEVDRNG
jgi:two-component system response regulator HydG